MWSGCAGALTPSMCPDHCPLDITQGSNHSSNENLIDLSAAAAPFVFTDLVLVTLDPLGLQLAVYQIYHPGWTFTVSTLFSCAETVLGVGPCGPFSPRSLHCPPDRHTHTCLTREICRKGVVNSICPRNLCMLLSRNGLLR